jgi:HemY protein
LFNHLGRGADAAQVIEHALKAQWTERLLEEYARCVDINVAAAIAQVETWMQLHGRSAAALRCLGRICLRARLWGKARTYLEESQRLDPNADTVLALGELAEAVGDGAAAAQCFREAALGLAERNAVPALARPRWFRREPIL